MPPTIRQQIEAALRSAGLHPGLQARAAVRMTSRSDAPGENETEVMRWVLTTEQPATVFDWNRWDFVDEVLLMEGMRVPAIGQVPLLDSHRRASVDDVLGSVSDFQRAEDIGGFAGIDGAVAFAADDKSQRTKQKVLDRHLTDGSVGYGVLKSVWIPEGESAAVKGTTYEGPLKVSYEWELREFSATPIGADTLAKVRAMLRKP